jgi:hypothetical protein
MTTIEDLTSVSRVIAAAGYFADEFLQTRLFVLDELRFAERCHRKIRPVIDIDEREYEWIEVRLDLSDFRLEDVHAKFLRYRTEDSGYQFVGPTWSEILTDEGRTAYAAETARLIVRLYRIWDAEEAKRIAAGRQEKEVRRATALRQAEFLRLSRELACHAITYTEWVQATAALG